MFILFLISAVLASQFFNETLTLTPFPQNKLLASFDFDIASHAKPLAYRAQSTHSQPPPDHYTHFPRALGPLIEAANVRLLHMRFTQGWWDSQSWGQLPAQGFRSGGTGVELWTVLEASSPEEARDLWLNLADSLSGFFCASLNFIDDSITTRPIYTDDGETVLANSSNSLYLLRAALPSEPICTENLTPFLKLLPSRGKAGISTLLDGHKVFDSLWHSMAIDISTQCADEGCFYAMHQSVTSVVDITRSLRRLAEGGIPKPASGDDLRCDDSKAHDIWQCFPLPDPTDLWWSIHDIYGSSIKGPAFADDPHGSSVVVNVDGNYWDVEVSCDHETVDLFADSSTTTAHHYITGETDITFKASNSSHVLPVQQPPVYVSRSLTGYSLDQGGLRVTFKNPGDSDVEFVYFESLPWFIRLYLHTMETSGNGEILDRYYKPAIDRKRPSHLELRIRVPKQLSYSLSYQFDKSLLLYAEYPPDANHGFSIEPSVVTVVDSNNKSVYQMRTTSLLLTLPTPDFSMPYNVIILTCTVMSLAFGSVFNLLTKRVVTEEEAEKLSGPSKISTLVAKVKRLRGGSKK